MNEFRVVDAAATPKPRSKDGGQFGSRRTSGLRPRSSAGYRSTLPEKLTGHRPTPADAHGAR